MQSFTYKSQKMSKQHNYNCETAFLGYLNQLLELDYMHVIVLQEHTQACIAFATEMAFFSQNKRQS